MLQAMVQTGNQIDLSNGYGGGSIDSTESCDEAGFGLATNCSHVQRSCDPSKLRKALKQNGILTECPQCSRESAGAGAGGDAGAATEELDEDGVAFEYEDSLWIW